MRVKTLRKKDILIFACSYKSTILRKDILYGLSHQRHSTETNCMKKSALSQAGFLFYAISHF